MKILILGGTGAMGKELVDILSDSENQIFVTSRKKLESSKDNLFYIQGNAHDIDFLKEILKIKYDSIVDFMSYSTSEFKERVNILLDNTKHYIYLSSSRVYANDKIISEDSNRILDVTNDKNYLQTDEYALAKARQENILLSSNKKSWTIVRPYITYNDNRLQLGFFEKEIWLSRILRGKTCVFPKCLLNKKTTLTYGKDVSDAISKLIIKNKALGKVVNIVNDNSNITWNDVLNIYSDTIKKYLKITPKFYYLDKGKDLNKLISTNYYQYYYDRCYDRIFDSSKLNILIEEKLNYQNLLKECLIKYLETDKKEIFLNGKIEGIMDRICKEKTSLNNFISLKEKIKYIIIRYTPCYYFIRRR